MPEPRIVTWKGVAVAIALLPVWVTLGTLGGVSEHIGTYTCVIDLTQPSCQGPKFAFQRLDLLRQLFPLTKTITVKFDSAGFDTFNSNYFVYSRYGQTFEVWGKSSGFSYINHKVYGQVNDACIRDTVASIDKNHSQSIDGDVAELLNHGAIPLQTRH